jgi:hypothetical protein
MDDCIEITQEMLETLPIIGYGALYQPDHLPLMVTDQHGVDWLIGEKDGQIVRKKRSGLLG